MSLRFDDDARHEYLEAIRLRPDLPNLHLELGQVYANTAQWPKAEAEFRIETKLQPGKAEAAYRLGNALLQQGKPKEALAESEKNARALLAKNPNDLLMLAQLGYIRKDLASVYFQEGRTSKGNETLESAEQCFKDVLARNADDPSGHNGLGNIYAMRGNQDAAMKEYDIATTLAPEYTYAWFDLALTLRNMASPPSQRPSSFRP